MRDNLMEDRRLNFNQPLLSVRRGSSVTASPEVNIRKMHSSSSTLPPLPYYKSELKSGPIRNPGVVPFQWEQMPGRPKYETKLPSKTIEQLPLAPKWPPGRTANHKPKPTDLSPSDSPSSSSRSQLETRISSNLDISSVEKVLSEFEGSDRKTEDKDVSSSDDDNVTYEDARDTLSRAESNFNCSVSGVSGLDDSSKPSSGAFSDPQTQDIMMSRFLPAAKAVASEIPEYASRKHSAARAQPKPVKVIKWKQSPQRNIVSDTVPYNIYGEKADEEADEEYEYDGTGEIPAKLCGLLPMFCLFNPIPGMRDHAPVVSSVRSVRTRPASRRIEKKDVTNKGRGELKKTPRQYGSTNEPWVGGNTGGETLKLLEIGSPQLGIDTKRGFLNLPEESRDLNVSKLGLQNSGGARFKEAFGKRGAQSLTSLTNPFIEKTLYVDSEHMEQCRSSNSSSSESRGRNPSVDYSLQDFRSICGTEEKSTSQCKSTDVADSSRLSPSEKSCQDVGEELVKPFQKTQHQNMTVDVVQRPKPDVKQTTHKTCSPVPLSPLLPKSPSESWLSRTLPSMPSKNPSAKSYLGNLAFRLSPVDPKWDRISRIPDMQHTIFQSAGGLGTISEN